MQYSTPTENLRFSKLQGSRHYLAVKCYTFYDTADYIGPRAKEALTLKTIRLA